MGDFLANHVAASFFGAIGVILYALGIAEQAQAIVTRFKAWQLQALGAAFFVTFVVMVLVSYDQGRDRAPEARGPVPAAIGDADLLPDSISHDYIALMSADHTDLQEQRFLKTHVGKNLELTLPLVGFERSGDWLQGQFYAGDKPDLFVMFSPEWEDHLLEKKVGEPVRFRARVADENGKYRLVAGRPL